MMKQILSRLHFSACSNYKHIDSTIIKLKKLWREKLLRGKSIRKQPWLLCYFQHPYSVISHITNFLPSAVL